MAKKHNKRNYEAEEKQVNTTAEAEETEEVKGEEPEEEEEEEEPERVEGDVVDSKTGKKVKQKVPLLKRIDGLPTWVKVGAGAVLGVGATMLGITIFGGGSGDESADDDEDGSYSDSDGSSEVEETT